MGYNYSNLRKMWNLWNNKEEKSKTENIQSIKREQLLTLQTRLQMWINRYVIIWEIKYLKN